jgi:hypothetical protein
VADALPDLVEGPPALGGMRLDLRATFLEKLGAEPLERFAKLEESQALLFARRLDMFRVGCEPRLVGRDGLALALGEPGQLRLELTLAAIEVRRPGHEAVLESLLDGRDGLRELDPRSLGLTLDVVAPLLGEPPLLFAQLMTRVRALPGQQAIELERPLVDLGLDEARQVGPRRLREPLELTDTPQAAGERYKAELGNGCRGQAPRSEEDWPRVREVLDEVDRMDGHGYHRRKPEDDGTRYEMTLAGASASERAEGDDHESEAYREGDFKPERH